MAKREDLKRKLKAADRRRRRRGENVGSANATSSATNNSAASVSEPPVDVIGMIVTKTLGYVHTSRAEVRDSAMVSAMRSCLEATTPSGDQAKALQKCLEEVSSQPGVDVRAYRSALTRMLELARQHHDPKNANAFIGYLAILAR